MPRGNIQSIHQRRRQQLNALRDLESLYFQGRQQQVDRGQVKEPRDEDTMQYLKWYQEQTRLFQSTNE